jgi:glycosyltransferase involved in cell wall biosynthesis
VVQPNFEFFPWLRNPRWPQPDLFAFPSLWRYDEVPFENKTYLPVPIATERFTPSQKPASAPTDFLHIIGKPAAHDRNGTHDLLTALRYVRSTIKLTIKCQFPDYVKDAEVPPNVNLHIDTAHTHHYWDNYRGYDVLVMPRRYGGLCLPVNEALGAGMPVIMPDIDPNNKWLPDAWLVPAFKAGEFMAKNMVDVYETDPEALAAKIDQFTDPDFYRWHQMKAVDLAGELSWEALTPRYLEVLTP